MFLVNNETIYDDTLRMAFVDFAQHGGKTEGTNVWHAVSVLQREVFYQVL